MINANGGHRVCGAVPSRSPRARQNRDRKRRIMKQSVGGLALMLGILGSVALSLGAAVSPEAPRLIPAAEVKQEVDRGRPVLFIDVRTHQEYRARRIRGARNLPLQTIRDGTYGTLPRDQLVVLY